MTEQLRFLGISGSLRDGSHSTNLLRAMAVLLDGQALLDVTTLSDVPLYDADLDGPSTPTAVVALRAAISHADALVICSPEYNYGVPGVLKNAIDWVSRPAYHSALKDKLVLVVTCSPGLFGGVRAQAQIKDALSACLALPLNVPQVAVPGVDKKMNGIDIIDDFTRTALSQALNMLIPRASAGRVDSALLYNPN